MVVEGRAAMTFRNSSLGRMARAKEMKDQKSNVEDSVPSSDNGGESHVEWRPSRRGAPGRTGGQFLVVLIAGDPYLDGVGISAVTR